MKNLEILWDKKDARHLASLNQGGGFYPFRVYIAVKNNTNKDIKNLRVFADSITSQGETFDEDVSLKGNSGEFESHTLEANGTAFFYVGECDADRTFTITKQTGEKILLPYNFWIKFGAESGKTSASLDVPFMWKDEGLVSP